MKRHFWSAVRLCLIIPCAGFLLLSCTPEPAVPAPSSEEPVRYVGTVQTDKYHHDGQLRHAVGVHNYQVFRANRNLPFGSDEVGWTYNHQPYLAYWNGKFHLQFLSGQVQEHTPPTRVLLMVSEDGRSWPVPIEVFPIYLLPEITQGDALIPAGTPAVMHQRMGFYVAPNGRLLTLGFYGFCATPRHSPNQGQGLGRVVREIYRDGTLGPVYFIRYNRHAGFNESNTDFPFYEESPDAGFVEACRELLDDKLATLQWWEEDRGEDGFFTIDPSQVLDEDPTASDQGVTTSAGAGKALCYYHRLDGAVVGIWKNQYSALSFDEGLSWSPIAKSTSLLTCGAKVWGQRTDDGRFALVHDHSQTRRNRFPLVVMTGDDGREFQDMFCVQGEVPPQRYQGIHKNLGPQYVRGIVEGNGNPPGDDMWITYSMNKEDIWVTRVRVPVTGTVEEHIDTGFESENLADGIDRWNIYQPRWTRVGISESEAGNRHLELRDEEPLDHAIAERAFPESTRVAVEFRVQVAEVPTGRALEVEVQDRHGARPMRLRLDREWLGLDRAQVFPLEPVAISTGKWYRVGLELDCDSQTYNLDLDGQRIRESVPFAEKVDSLERLVFRTGPSRGDVRAVIAENGEPRPAGLYTEDLPDPGIRDPMSRFLVDDVVTGALP